MYTKYCFRPYRFSNPGRDKGEHRYVSINHYNLGRLCNNLVSLKYTCRQSMDYRIRK